ncbi:hypothetical protein MOQ_003770 [Trypanosoma cruzi marinkellei]|uniref:Uncharacterized protein n=1 Tax=Trypanosoma cruzi marinkellei TaxID=85056 RepID=K2MZ65_TRYCR|nr:hypothetical protein MOQ_003770 [Trypanosoma cruzi marinkellei]
MDDTQQLRARRRYRALLRQAESLQKIGQIDATLSVELQKLEQEYPDLKKALGSVEGGIRLSTNCAINKETTEKKLFIEKTATVTTSTCPTEEKKQDFDSHSASPAGHFTDELKHTDSANDGEKRKPAARFSGGVAFFSCAVNIWTESHLPTSFSIFSYITITLMTIFVAFLHRYFVDPCSLVGKSISPLLLSYLVHFQGLFLVHLKRPERISRAMLLVYLVFDVLPSMLFVLFVYMLTTITLELFEQSFSY